MITCEQLRKGEMQAPFQVSGVGNWADNGAINQKRDTLRANSSEFHIGSVR